MEDGLAVVSRGRESIWRTLVLVLVLVLVYCLVVCDDWGEMNRGCVREDWTRRGGSGKDLGEGRELMIPGD
jgi:hypothetical protein